MSSGPIRRFLGKWFKKFEIRFLLSWYRENEFAQFEDIRLSDCGSGSPHFEKILPAALQLLKEIDPRRFSRVNRRIRWVVNRPLPRRGAEYDHKMQACVIDFQKPESESDYPHSIASHASTLIHEATHGVIRARGIRYSPELRVRIEHLCVTEQNRFARRLSSTQPEIAERLHREFDESHWHPYWKTTNIGRFFAVLRRVRSGRHK